MTSFKALLGASLQDIASLAIADVEVAVVDSGVDATHPDLAGRISAAYAIAPGTSPNPVNENSAVADNDLCGHGTGVASIIARIAPRCRIVDIRILNSDGSIEGRQLVAGFRYAVDRGCSVINLSLASVAAFAAELSEISENAYFNGQIVCAARRNMPLSGPSFPAELSSCAGVDRTERPPEFLIDYFARQNVEFAAAGDEVIVAAPGGGYSARTGTSFATPVVSGLCALLKACNPTLTPFEVKTLLKMLSTPP